MIFGGAQIEFGGQINLSQLENTCKIKIIKWEKQLHKPWITGSKKMNHASRKIYDELVHLRHDMALKLGFSNFIELAYLRLGRTDYDATMVANYRKQLWRSGAVMSKTI